jgi:hypothetical protein
MQPPSRGLFQFHFMRRILIEKLHAYICEHNPELLIELKVGFSLTQYLSNKYQSVEPLLNEILEEEFTGDYLMMKESGTLTYETINMITACAPVFEEMNFSVESEDDENIRVAVMGSIKDYLSAFSTGS